jgi:hypothetical protein
MCAFAIAKNIEAESLPPAVTILMLTLFAISANKSKDCIVTQYCLLLLLQSSHCQLGPVEEVVQLQN